MSFKDFFIDETDEYAIDDQCHIQKFQSICYSFAKITNYLKFLYKIQKIYRTNIGIVSFKYFLIDETYMKNLVNSVVAVVTNISQFMLQAEGIHMVQLYRKEKSEFFMD